MRCSPANHRAGPGREAIFFFRARSEFGGPSVAVRGGVQLGAASCTSMSSIFFSREASSEALPWRCGAGFSSEQLRAPRCRFFVRTHPEAGPVFTSSQLKYRSHRALLVFFGFHRNFSERDFSGSGQLDVPHGAKVPIGSSQSP